MHNSENNSSPDFKRRPSVTHRSPLLAKNLDPNPITNFFFGSDELVNIFIFTGRVLVFIGFGLWGYKFITQPMGSMEFAKSFMHNVNLVFHEAGHVIFSPFGRLIKSFGGSLNQVLIPFIVAIAFLFKSNPFGATIGLWWTGQSMMDIAPYIADARIQKLILLGGVTGRDAPNGFHDWNFILGELGLLSYDRTLALTVHIMGLVLIVTALLWGAALLVRQARRLDL